MKRWSWIILIAGVLFSACSSNESKPTVGADTTNHDGHDHSHDHDHDHDGHSHEHDSVIVTYEDYIQTGEKLLAGKDYEMAAIQFLDAARSDSNRVEGWYGLGYCFSQLNSNKKAIQYFDMVIAIDSTYRQALSNRGNCKTQLGLNEEALPDLNNAIALDESCGTCYINRARVLSELDRSDEMCSDLQKAQSLGMEEADPLISKYCAD